MSKQWFIEEQRLGLGDCGELHCPFPCLTPNPSLSLSDSKIALEAHSLIAVIAEWLLDRTGCPFPKIQSENSSTSSTLYERCRFWARLPNTWPYTHSHAHAQACNTCVHAGVQCPIASQGVPRGQQLTTGTWTSRLPEAASTAGTNQSLERKTQKENSPERHCLKSSERFLRTFKAKLIRAMSTKQSLSHLQLTWRAPQTAEIGGEDDSVTCQAENRRFYPTPESIRKGRDWLLRSTQGNLTDTGCLVNETTDNSFYIYM